MSRKDGGWASHYTRERSHAAEACVTSMKYRAIARKMNKHEVQLGFRDFVRDGRCFRHTPEGSTYPIKHPAPD